MPAEMTALFQAFARRGPSTYEASHSEIAAHECYAGTDDLASLDRIGLKFGTPNWVLECPCHQISDRQKLRRFFENALFNGARVSYVKAVGVLLLILRAPVVRRWRDRNAPQGPRTDGRPMRDEWHDAALTWIAVLLREAGSQPNGWKPLPYGMKSRLNLGASLSSTTWIRGDSIFAPGSQIEAAAERSPAVDFCSASNCADEGHANIAKMMRDGVTAYDPTHPEVAAFVDRHLGSVSAP